MNERREDGFSMIELMLVVVVVAVGTMTMTSGILVSKTASMDLEEQSLVRLQTREIVERVRALDYGAATDTVAEVVDAPTTGQILDLLSPLDVAETAIDASTVLTGGSAPALTVQELRVAGNLTWWYDMSDLPATSTANINSGHARRRMLSAVSRKPWEMEIVNDLNADGSTTGAFEGSGKVAIVEVRYGGKVRARVVVAADPED